MLQVTEAVQAQQPTVSFLLHHCSHWRSPRAPSACTKSEITKTPLCSQIKPIPSILLIWKRSRLHLPPVLSSIGLPSVNFLGFFNENFPLPAAFKKEPCSCSYRSCSCCVDRSSGWLSQACTCSGLQKQKAFFRKERAFSIQWQPSQNLELTPNKSVTELTCLLQRNRKNHIFRHYWPILLGDVELSTRP